MFSGRKLQVFTIAGISSTSRLCFNMLVQLLTVPESKFCGQVLFREKHVLTREAKVDGKSDVYFTSWSALSELRCYQEWIIHVWISPISGFSRVCFHGITPAIPCSPSSCPTLGESSTFGSFPQLLRGCLYRSLLHKHKVIFHKWIAGGVKFFCGQIRGCKLSPHFWDTEK